MKRQPRILAGTAIGLLMASAPLGAYPLQGGVTSGGLHGAPLVLAQAACAEGQSAEECAQGGAEQPRKKKREQQQQSESAPATEQAAPAETEQKPRKKRQELQQMQSGQSDEAAPAEQQLKPRKKRDQQQQTESAPAEQGGQPATEEQQFNPRKKKREQQTEAAPADQGGQPATEEQQPRKKKRNQQVESAPAEQPAEQAAPDQQQQLRKKKLNQQQQSETAPAEQATPDQQQLRKKKLNQQQQSETAPAEQATPDQQQLRKKKLNQQQGETAPAEQAAPDQQQLRKKKLNQQQQEAAPAEQPSEQPANDNQPGKQRKQAQQPAEQSQTPAEQTPAGQGSRKLKPLPVPGTAQAPAETEQAPAQQEQPSNQNKRQAKKPLTEQPATGQQQPATGEQPANNQPANNNQPESGGNAAQGAAPANPNEAPVLDSQKDAMRRHKGRQPASQNETGQAGAVQSGNQAEQQGGNQAGQQQGGEQAQRPAPVDQGPPPTDDKSAQQAIKPEKIVPVDQEKGKRIELTPEQVVRERRRPQGADVVKQFGDRVILQFNNQTFVESNEAPRITRGARDVYYEDLSDGRTREIVERDNGVRVITIRNRNGDVIRRSRITSDGREYVLSYVDERYYNDVDEWRDPGDDLPPMRLDIPRRDYILDSEEVEDPDEYYTFLEQPPVERVQRLYSIDEVKRSARVRDIARRIDLDTLNFDFGSATISDTEVQKLEGVATAMEKLLKKNPAETFLIEGHTDAVGTPDANLALSDRRAEAVAEALTNAFGIPAENLTTQGYGEEYLKVNTPGPNRENRRVAIRRITSLVAPVASNSEQQ
ncbi:OmpA family protein [Mesorhizobium argentiipisi]|uniref:OmpA family protein n=1 Tax=Mesorhizobium argentiipisi TaxID=3015175 RepID=A0ABU8K635_9HYPH